MHTIIVGGGRIGIFLAKRLLQEKHVVVIIEKIQEIANEVARVVEALVINGEGCEPAVLQHAGAENADVVVALTGKDEDNFIICQIAKEKFKVHRTIARVNDPENERAFNELGVDVPIGATVIRGLGRTMTIDAQGYEPVDALRRQGGHLILSLTRG